MKLGGTETGKTESGAAQSTGIRQRVRQAAARLRRPVSAWLASDAVRLPAQTVIAVLCAYTIMRTLGMPEITWGAFSALYVGRASLDGAAGVGREGLAESA